MSGHRWLYAWGLGSVALGAASLLVPLYVVALGGTPVDLGLLGAVAAAVGAPGAIVWGRLADRTTDPRSVVVASLAGSAAVLAALPLLPSIRLVIAANAALWLAFAAAGPVLTLAVLADVPERKWDGEIALLNAYQGYGWAGGFLLGVLWSATVGRALPPTAAQRWLLAACGGIAAVSAALFALWMPSPSTRRLARVDPRRVARALSTGRRNVRGATFVFAPNRLYWASRSVRPRRLAERFTPSLAGYFLAVVLFFTGFAAFFAPLPLYLADVGFSPDFVFGLYLVSALGAAASYTAAGRLAAAYDLRLLHAGTLGVRSVTIPLVAVTGTAAGATLAGTAAAVALFAIVGATWAVIAVTAGAIVTRLAPPSLRGEALGVYAALGALAGGIGSVGGGLLADLVGFGAAFGAAGGAVLLGAVLVGALRGISERTRPAGATRDVGPGA